MVTRAKPQSHGPEVLSDKALALASVLFFCSCYLASRNKNLHWGEERHLYCPTILGKKGSVSAAAAHTRAQLRGGRPTECSPLSLLLTSTPRGVMSYVFHMKLRRISKTHRKVCRLLVSKMSGISEKENK